MANEKSGQNSAVYGSIKTDKHKVNGYREK